MRLKIVQNWRKGWRWFSVWAFVLIVFFATEPLPPEVVAILPKPVADNLIVLTAVCGVILRFVQQTETKRKDGNGREYCTKAQDNEDGQGGEQ